MPPRTRSLPAARLDAFSVKFFDCQPDSVDYRTNAAIFLGFLKYMQVEGAHKQVSTYVMLGSLIIKHSAHQFVGGDCHEYSVSGKESHSFRDKPMREVCGIGVSIH